MNKVILVAILGLTFGCSNPKKNGTNDQIPEVVKSSFAVKYPNASKLIWGDENGSFEVSFVQNKTEFSVVFDSQGKFMEEETEIKVSALTKTVVDYCKSNYSDHKILEAAKITTNSGEIKYEAELSKGKMHFDVIFDVNGKFISKEASVSEDED